MRWRSNQRKRNQPSSPTLHENGATSAPSSRTSITTPTTTGSRAAATRSTTSRHGTATASPKALSSGIRRRSPKPTCPSEGRRQSRARPRPGFYFAIGRIRRTKARRSVRARYPGGDSRQLRLPETKYPEESRAVRGQPLSRSVPYFAGDNSPIECCELIEAHYGWNLQPRSMGGGKRRHVWPGAGRRRDKAYDQVASALIFARDHQGRSAFGA